MAEAQDILRQNMHKKNLGFRPTNVEISLNTKLRLRGYDRQPGRNYQKGLLKPKKRPILVLAIVPADATSMTTGPLHYSHANYH